MGVRSRFDPITGTWHTVVRQPPPPRVFLRLDTLDAPLQHPCNGLWYESKSAFRAVTKAYGCVERGTDRIPPKVYEPDDRKIEDTILRAKQKVEQGYKPVAALPESNPELAESIQESAAQLITSEA